jgi:hypothetical protein
MVEDQEMELKLINEGDYMHELVSGQLANYGKPEYKTWKKNSPFLYDMILRYGYLEQMSCSSW